MKGDAKGGEISTSVLEDKGFKILSGNLKDKNVYEKKIFRIKYINTCINLNF
jgi:hypothetical protein